MQGFHPYNENDIDDINKINICDLDVRKRSIAKENNLH